VECGNSVNKFTATAVLLTLLTAATPALAGEQLVLIVSAASKTNSSTPWKSENFFSD